MHWRNWLFNTYLIISLFGGDDGEGWQGWQGRAEDGRKGGVTAGTGILQAIVVELDEKRCALDCWLTWLPTKV